MADSLLYFCRRSLETGRVNGANSPWVGFPEIPGRNKFFPIIEAKGRIERAITMAVLDAFRESKKEAS
jgi:hypothetical protein